MKKILILGAGKMGALLALRLHQSQIYHPVVADNDLEGVDFRRVKQRFSELNARNIDVSHTKTLDKLFDECRCEAVISCLPYYLNSTVAKAAKKHHCHYFDLTEDIKTTREIRNIAEGSSYAFVPQCGIAPGMVGMIANDLIQKFSQAQSVVIRVGALPQNTHYALGYALTWSTEGLINQYANEGIAIKDGKLISTQPLEEQETLRIDEDTYEAFNTSGGLGNLPEICGNQIQNMNYKSLRYPGHCERMKFLMNDLKLKHDRQLLQKILENALPKIYQDVVIVYISVKGMLNNEFIEQNYVKKFYPKIIDNLSWSAIQMVTTTGLLCVLMEILENDHYKGFIFQEQLPLAKILQNPFGSLFKES